MNGSGAGPDKIVSQVFKDLISNLNGNTVLIFLKLLTKLPNFFVEEKEPKQQRLFFFWGKSCRHHKEGWRFATHCHRQHAQARSSTSRLKSQEIFWERQIFFGSIQLQCSITQGAEIAAHSFKKLIYFNSLVRETMLNHVFLNNPILY